MRIISQVVGGTMVVAALAGSYYYNDFAQENKTQTFVVSFSTGTAVNNPDELMSAYNALRDNSNYRLRVVGHSGTRGNPASNARLSFDRARQVFNDFTGEEPNLGILNLKPIDRFDESIGEYSWHGGSIPLEREENESDRAYQNRLSRTEIVVYYGGNNEQN